MTKLTDYQTKVVNTLKRDRAKIQTSEGRDYKVWVVYPNGNRITIRRDTASALFTKGYITLNDKSKSTFFEYILTGKN